MPICNTSETITKALKKDFVTFFFFNHSNEVKKKLGPNSYFYVGFRDERNEAVMLWYLHGSRKIIKIHLNMYTSVCINTFRNM